MPEIISEAEIKTILEAFNADLDAAEEAGKTEEEKAARREEVYKWYGIIKEQAAPKD